MSNTRRFLTLGNNTLTIKDWSLLTGISVVTIKRRLKDGWPLVYALSVPTKPEMIEHDGETMSLADWATRTGISATTLYMRLRLGWSPSQALTVPTLAPGQKLNPTKRKWEGVASDFAAVSATGAPRLARDISQLEISE